MEVIDRLIERLRHTGVLLLVGFILIIYIAFGFLYLQQDTRQKALEVQINKVSAVVARPLPSREKLQAEYDEVNRSLAAVTDIEAIALIVGIAEKSGIDISPANNKFRIPSAKTSPAKVDGGNYQIVSFDSIYVQGNYDNVMAFISDLDSGKTLKTMVLEKVETRESPLIRWEGEEADRRAEFRKVISAVTNMMSDNGLSEIPKPMCFASEVATDNMSRFPDATCTAIEKGYTGPGSPRAGYVLYTHDKVTTGNTARFETVNYIDILTTNYCYTCEADGTVRQFNGANVDTATEYLGSAEYRIETIASVNVKIYTKPKK